MSVLVSAAAMLLAGSAALPGSAGAQVAPPGSLAVIEAQSLDGSGNNTAHPDWGRSGANYSRVAPARYADGRGQPVTGPNSRYVSNRVFDDRNQNLFNDSMVTQWGFVWGQFLDHTFGLRDETGPAANIPFSTGDPLEEFANTLGVIPFARSGAAAGTGVTSQREQPNTVSSYIDAWTVYGGTQERLEWLREGPVDGNLANNGARLLMPNALLPTRDARGNAAAAPAMAIDGRLRATPNRAVVAGDVRASENVALTATHTLFAREHNRIVGLLPNSLSEEDKFQIARRIVIAEQQYITYTEFLPSVGVRLPGYSGYNPNVNATLSNEFAVVGYRAHSMIHGEIEIEADAGRYTPAVLDALRAQGIEIAASEDGEEVEIAVPLNVAFFNPDLIGQIQLGPLLQGIGLEAQYKNDEQIDNQLRSVLFQVPVSGNPECLDGPTLAQCFNGVIDLGAVDIERGRDHGMPSYNQMRQAYGLAPRPTFSAITGESSDAFPADPSLTAGNEINDPNSTDFMGLTDIFGSPVEFGTDAAEGEGVIGARRTPIAARLRAIYGSVDNVDAFVGMVAEPHAAGSQFGELQQAIWASQFRTLRDGDRFFYGNDPGLSLIRSQFGIDYRRTLSQVIASNTDIPQSALAPNVFFVDGRVPPASCRVTYTVTTTWPGGFQASMRVQNTGSQPIDGWTLRFRFPEGQTVTDLWNGAAAQAGANVPVDNVAFNGVLAPGAAVDGIGFNAASNNSTVTRPPAFSVNTTPCATG